MTGVFVNGGELLIDPSSSRYIFSSLPIMGMSNDHSLAIPTSASLAGVTARAQGIVLGGGFHFCNAYDLTIGF
jgi:hypothetical protein